MSASSPERLLVIGSCNYSSWSLRPWLFMKHAGLPFREEVLHLGLPESNRRLLALFSGGKVPVLCEGDRRIWDSLAILEHLAEQHPDSRPWPEDAEARAAARSVSAEMHSSFSRLRRELPMNCREVFENFSPGEAVQREIDRITALWRHCRARHGQGGPWLFGNFSIADAMYAPVASRFLTYGVPLDEVSAVYRDTVLAHPAMYEWMAAARREQHVIAGLEKPPDPSHASRS